MAVNSMAQAEKNSRDDFNSSVESLKDVASNIKEELGQAKKIATNATRRQGRDWGSIGSDRLEQFGEYVQERPLTSVLIGAAVGYFLGMLSRR